MQKVLSFIQDLANHNDRDWFESHREEYEAARSEFSRNYDQILVLLNQHDQIDGPASKIYRIYRDLRFSSDKTPYKTRFSAHWVRATAARRGGYYLHIQPGRSYLAGGFFGPSADDLSLIRQHLHQEAEPLRTVLRSPGIADQFGPLQGRQLKTHPRGFSSDDPAIDLLRYKQFFLKKSLSDSEVLSPDFPAAVGHCFYSMRPFLDVMTELLTTNTNGESLLQP